MKGALKDIIEWINNNLHTDVIKYITDPQEHTTNNIRRAKNALINQGVKADNVQYNNTSRNDSIEYSYRK